MSKTLRNAITMITMSFTAADGTTEPVLFAQMILEQQQVCLTLKSPWKQTVSTLQ